MIVPWMLLTPAFVLRWSVGPARLCTQRVPFKTGVRSFSWQGMDWCGGQPGGDGWGIGSAGQVAFVCYFWASEGWEGREEAANKGCLYPPPSRPLSSPTRTRTVTSHCHRQMKGLCVFMAGLCVQAGGK